MNRRAPLLSAATLAAVFVTLLSLSTRAADEKPDPTTKPAYTGPRIVTLDDQFVEVGELVPDFGGMYLKGDALQIVVKNLGRLSRKERKAKQIELEAALQTVFEDSLEGKAEKVRLVEGRYSVLELQSWYRNFGEILALPGVDSADLDEVANRLKIVVTGEAPESEIKGLLREWHVPSDAVVIEVGAVVDPSP
ncbi:MAG: hypothetical protein GY769_16130 [bacterium]|nr:hypothetical protein [bacterium]